MWIHDQHGPNLVNKQSRASCKSRSNQKKIGSFQLAVEPSYPPERFPRASIVAVCCDHRSVLHVVKGAVTAVKIVLLITRVIIICVFKSYQRVIYPSIYFYSIYTNPIYILYTTVKYKQFMRRDMTWTHGPSHELNSQLVKLPCYSSVGGSNYDSGTSRQLRHEKNSTQRVVIVTFYQLCVHINFNSTSKFNFLILGQQTRYFLFDVVG